jgi:hypothetical protein
MRQSNFFPLVLLFGGLVAAFGLAVAAFVDPSTEYGLLFAIASLVGVLGWRELTAGEDFNESFDGE